MSSDTDKDINKDSDNEKDMKDDTVYTYIIVGYTIYEKRRYDKKVLKIFKLNLSETQLEEYKSNRYFEKRDITILSIHKLDNDYDIQEFNSKEIHISSYCEKECCDK